MSYIFADILAKALRLDITDTVDDLYDNESNLLTKAKNPTPNMHDNSPVNIFLEINKLCMPFEIKNWLLNVCLIFLHNTEVNDVNKKILIQLLNYFVVRKKYPVSDLEELVVKKKFENILYKHFMILFSDKQDYSDYLVKDDKTKFSIYQLYNLYDNYTRSYTYSRIINTNKSFQNIIMSTRLTFNPLYMQYHSQFVNQLLNIFNKAKDFQHFHEFVEYMQDKWEECVCLMYFMIAGENDPVYNIGSLPMIQIPDACCSLFQTNYINELCDVQGGDACFLLTAFVTLETCMNITRKWPESFHPTPSLLYFLIPPYLQKNSPYAAISCGFTSGPDFADYNAMLISSRGGYHILKNEKAFFDANMMNIHVLTLGEKDEIIKIEKDMGRWLLFPMYVGQHDTDFVKRMRTENVITYNIYQFLNISSIQFTDRDAVNIDKDFLLTKLRKIVLANIQHISLAKPIFINIIYNNTSIPAYNMEIIKHESLDIIKEGKLTFFDEHGKKYAIYLLLPDESKEELIKKWEIVVKNKQYQYFPGTAKVKLTYEIKYMPPEVFEIHATIVFCNVNINLLQAPIVNSLF